MDRNDRIKKYCADGLSINEIADVMNLKYQTIYSVVRKHDFDYTRRRHVKQNGDYDIKPRTRRWAKRSKSLTEGGGVKTDFNYDDGFNKVFDIDKFLKQTWDSVNEPITNDNLHKWE